MVKLVQANLHHAIAASAVMERVFIGDRLDAALIQEPYLKEGGVAGLGSKDLCRDDLVAAFVNVRGWEGERIVLCSAYLDGDKRDPTEELRLALDYARTHDAELLVGCDANAHHTFWGSTGINPRDCLYLQLYREPADRWKRAPTKASLSLAGCMGFESGFALDREAHTLAALTPRNVHVLAFDSRERLIAWQVRLQAQLGASKEFLVIIAAGAGTGAGKKLPAGPARLHLHGAQFALAAGTPPRLLGLWEIQNLRRYGVVEDKFCWEGGSRCGRGEGLHVVMTERASALQEAFRNAAAVASVPAHGIGEDKSTKSRPETRLSDINPSVSDNASGLYEESFFTDGGRISPLWPPDDSGPFNDTPHEMDSGPTPPWGGANHITLERCNSCINKLSVTRKQSTIPVETDNFKPAWKMEPLDNGGTDTVATDMGYLTPIMIRKHIKSQSKDVPPQRPPKPSNLEQTRSPISPSRLQGISTVLNNTKVGPYENYDVPKPIHNEVEFNEYYDTPKRIKQSLTDDLFKVSQNSTPDSLVLKKNCGCILKLASKKKPVIVECEENLQPVECPCQKVTNWANNLISLPYCKKTINTDKVNTEILTAKKSEEMALYATVDVARKSNRQSSSMSEKDSDPMCETFGNYENVEPSDAKQFEGNYANYENLEFALSLEFYENAKDLLKKAGVTQNELDALSANIEISANTLPRTQRPCAKCTHCQKQDITTKNKTDEYLIMEPTKDKRDVCPTTGPNPGYTPMSPCPNWTQSLRHPTHKLHKMEIEKSYSIPTLNDTLRDQSFDGLSNNNQEKFQKRSISVDSTRLLEDLKEFDSSIGSHATSSSLETLRNLATVPRDLASPCNGDGGCCQHNCSQSSEEHKTSETGVSRDVLYLRNKHADDANKRSSNVPGKCGNRDSSSSNDSGVSSCSLKQGVGEYGEDNVPPGSPRLPPRAGVMPPRKSKSSDPLRGLQRHMVAVPAKSSSAEAEVPVLPPKQLRGVVEGSSTSSGTSELSDYMETLSLTSSHSSCDLPAPANPHSRVTRLATSTLRPRSGKEYKPPPALSAIYDIRNPYTNLP